MSGLHKILLILVSIAFGLAIPVWNWPTALIFAGVMGLAYGILFRKPKRNML
jgi:small-conductance mechanosensitive channel